MRTESDLRTALRSLEREAPSPETVLPDPDDAPHRRRPAILIAAAVTATAAIATAIPLYLARTASDPDREAARPSGTPWRFSYSLSLPAGWTLMSESVQSAGQMAMVIPPKLGGSTCAMTSFERGQFDEALLVKPRPIELSGGRQGYLAEVASWRSEVDKFATPAENVTTKVYRPVVAEEYATDSWRISDCAWSTELDTTAARTRVIQLAQQLASAVSDKARSVRTPVALAYLPQGWPEQTVQLPDSSDADGTSFSFDGWATGHGPLELGPPMVRSDAPKPSATATALSLRSVGVTVLPGNVVPALRKGKRITIDGRTAWVSPYPTPRSSNPAVYAAVVSIQGTGYNIQLHSMSTVADYTPELIKVAQGMRIAADPLDFDHRSWFDSSTAIPRP